MNHSNISTKLLYNGRSLERQNAPWAFALLYCIYLLLAVVNPDISISEIPVRHFFTVVLLIMCYRYGKKKVDWFIVVYLFFLFFYFLAGATSGYGSVSLMKIIATYLVSLVLYKATTILVSYSNGLSIVSFVLLFLFFVDAVVAIGQYYQIPFFMILPELFGIELKDFYMERFQNRVSMEGFSVVGIVGPVLNGYILSAATILAWYPLRGGKFYYVISFIVWAVCFVASFYSQERAGFYLAIAFSLYIFYLCFSFLTHKGFKWLFFALIILAAILYSEDLFEIIVSSGRYNMGMEADDRLSFIDRGMSFIVDNPMGGIDLYTQQTQRMPHNLFINMFIAGGWIGGIIILSIVIYQMVKCAQYILTVDKRANWIPFLYVLLYINFTAQSLVHNNSIVYGGSLFFVFWGVCARYVSKRF